MSMKTKEALRALIIDDDPNDVALIALELGKTYQIVWQRVETEAEVILALETEWDVILCDYKMPTLSVEKVLELTRISITSHFVPFIVISGIVDEPVVADLLLRGANDFISKDHLSRLAFAIRREVATRKQAMNERLRRNLMIRETLDKTIEAWGKALEIRDIHTQGHTVRVADLATRLGVAMGLDRQQLLDLYRGALLHDIGKLGIPDAVLLKPDTLDPDELLIIQKHPVIACEMLREIPMLEHAMVVPCCHHERWNGTGYPKGLKGLDIPFLARLFAVIDVYDALTSERPYRKSWDKAHAIAYLLEESGISFDSQVVEAFVEMVGRG